MFPFFSRMFPGTNLQDLNLDWIVRRIMELSKGIIAPWINAQNQHWMVYDTAAETFVDSGVSAAGEGTGPQGEPGKSPVIGTNGNWYTWDTTTQAYADTGIHAEGPEGPAGPRANNNQLDNWYFPNPVNQRGQNAWQNAGEFTVDRWKLTSGSASLGASGLTLNGTLTQLLETAIGMQVTCSALLSDGTMITPTYDDNTKTFTLTATGQTIVAVKLEIGAVQTLAHQANSLWVLNDIPDYGQELAKCQRYFYHWTGAFYVPTFSNGECYGSINNPVKMAGIPTITNVTYNTAWGTPDTPSANENQVTFHNASTSPIILSYDAAISNLGG